MILLSIEKETTELRQAILDIGGVPCEKHPLRYGDIAFEGNLKQGRGLIGIERKKLHDMLHCIDDNHYNKQRVGMSKMYKKSFLALEGHWKPKENGILMEGFNGGTAWADCRYRSRQTMYNKLYRYLLSVSLSGVIITYSRDLKHTAFNALEMYHYFQKPWDQHRSLLQLYEPQLPINVLTGHATTTRRWAYALDGVGEKYSGEADLLFKKPIKLATSEEQDWLRIEGIGPATAQKIIREINGWD